MDIQHGYEALFLSEVTTHLKCGLCHLVLRKPVAILTCGHKFCHVCFEQLKKNNEATSEFHCPIDRNVIDLEHVVEDITIQTFIEKLQVKCNNSDNGCGWSGQLKELEDHLGSCEHSPKHQYWEQEEETIQVDCKVLKGIYSRLEKMEDNMKGKDKEILNLKFNMNEMKKELAQGKPKREQEEYVCVNNSGGTPPDEKDFRRLVEKENQVLSLQIKMLENKISSFGTSLQEVTKATKNVEMKFTQQVEVVEGKLSRSVEELKEQQGFVSLQRNLKVVEDELKKTKDDLTCLSSTMGKRMEEVKESVRKNKVGLTRKVDVKEDVDKHEIRIATLESIATLEGIAQNYAQYPPRKFMVEWKIHNFKYNSGQACLVSNYYQRRCLCGEMGLTSPLYTTPCKGYTLSMCLKWPGRADPNTAKHFIHDNASLCVYVNSQNVHDPNRQPFALKITVMIIRKDGKVDSKMLNSAAAAVVSSEGFKGSEFPLFGCLEPEVMEYYLVDDALTIQCLFELKN